MSIYATLWTVQFPRDGQDYIGCEWIEVRAQGVPGHIGTPTPGHGYEAGDPYGDFLPPPIELEGEDDDRLRAVVIVTSEATKGTGRSPQEFADPLLVLTGAEYKAATFDGLHRRICDALRAGKPRLVAQQFSGDGTTVLHFEDGSTRTLSFDPVH